MQNVFICGDGPDILRKNPFARDGAYDRGWTIITLKSLPQAQSGIHLMQEKTPDGIYHMTLNRDAALFDTLGADILQYETSYGRKILLASDRPVDETAAWVDGFTTYFKEPVVRTSDPRFLVHSTPLPTYTQIKRDGMLKCTSRLRRGGIIVSPVGFDVLGEPEDYLDHIMFAAGGVTPEIVVNSHLCGIESYDTDVAYVPQARMYFDAHRVIRDGLFVRDAGYKVHDHLPLEPYLLCVVTAGDLVLPEGEAYWTPAVFAREADAYVERLWLGGARE